MKLIKKTALLVSYLILLVSCSTTEESSTGSVTSANTQALGSSANDFLSDEKFTSLKIEIVNVSGYEPSPATLDNLKNFFKKYIHKPGGISIVQTAIASPGGGPYSISDVKNIEKENRTYYNSGKELTVFIFFADGNSASDEGDKTVLGTAYRNTSIVIFEKTIKDFANRHFAVSKSDIESSTMKHEFGHLFGLVNNGSTAQSDHIDPENKAHCNKDGCLMGASLEFGSGILAFIKSSHTIDLDESCHEDLRANGGK